MALAKVNGTELFYEVTGEGEPIVLIPGLGTTHKSFAGVVPGLARNHKVIGVDLRGVGQSAKPKQHYSMELWADDIAALLDHLGLRRTHIFGSSLGGCVALAFADRHRAKTCSLMLAATFSEIDALLELNYRVRIALIEKVGMTQLLADFAVTALFGRTFYETDQGRAIAANTLAMIQQNEKDMYAEHLRAVLRFGRCEPGQEREESYTARLKKMENPALVMVGDEDVLTVAKFSKIMADALPDAELKVLSPCGHLTIVEKAEETAQLVTDFLKRNPLPKE
jgi:pimeloyl-ACP methyl ester carboxylesterase